SPTWMPSAAFPMARKDRASCFRSSDRNHRGRPVMTPQFVDLDVRPILRSGGEPFQEIMGTVAALRPGEGLRLLATFKPEPLFSVLGAKGFSHEERQIDGGDWEVLFHPATAAESPPAPEPAPAVASADAAAWPEPVQHLDNRELDPP